MIYLEFLAGMLGFIGFESLRIYKILWQGADIIPLKRSYLYCFILITLGIFSGFVSIIFATGSFTKSVIIGFSIPSNFKNIIAQPEKEGEQSKEIIEEIRSETNIHDVDDIPDNSDINIFDDSFSSVNLNKKSTKSKKSSNSISTVIKTYFS